MRAATPPQQQPREAKQMPAPLVAQVSDHFNVMQLIEDPDAASDSDDARAQTDARGAGGGSSSSASSNKSSSRGQTHGGDGAWPASTSLGSAASAGSPTLLDLVSPAEADGFGSPFSADDLARTPRSAERAKNRRWTVNVPSVAHLGPELPRGAAAENPFGLLLPPLSESGDDRGGGSGFLRGGSDNGAQHASEDLDLEEARLQAQLAAVRERKQLAHGHSSGHSHTGGADSDGSDADRARAPLPPGLPPGPPPSPPPSPPRHPRRFSALDVGAVRAGPLTGKPWSTPPGGPVSLGPRAALPQQALPLDAVGGRLRGHTLSTHLEHGAPHLGGGGDSSEFARGAAAGRGIGHAHMNQQQLQQQLLQQQHSARSRRHTVGGHSPEPLSFASFFADTDADRGNDEQLHDGASDDGALADADGHGPTAGNDAPLDAYGEYMAQLYAQHQHQQHQQHQQLTGHQQHQYDAAAHVSSPQALYAQHAAFYAASAAAAAAGAPPPPPPPPAVYMYGAPHLPPHMQHLAPDGQGGVLLPPGVMFAPPPGAAGYSPHAHAQQYMMQLPPHMYLPPGALHRGGSGGSSPGGGAVAPKQATGPPGANVFVFNFPRVFEDVDLRAAFAPFGPIISATVFIDKATGKSKCFGFVSYEHAESAQAAIARMNGATLGGKPVKVQIKRERPSRNGASETNPQDHGQGAGPAQVGEM